MNAASPLCRRRPFLPAVRMAAAALRRRRLKRMRTWRPSSWTPVLLHWSRGMGRARSGASRVSPARAGQWVSQFHLHVHLTAVLGFNVERARDDVIGIPRGPTLRFGQAKAALMGAHARAAGAPSRVIARTEGPMPALTGHAPGRTRVLLAPASRSTITTQASRRLRVGARPDAHQARLIWPEGSSRAAIIDGMFPRLRLSRPISAVTLSRPASPIPRMRVAGALPSDGDLLSSAAATTRISAMPTILAGQSRRARTRVGSKTGFSRWPGTSEVRSFRQARAVQPSNRLRDRSRETVWAGDRLRTVDLSTRVHDRTRRQAVDLVWRANPDRSTVDGPARSGAPTAMPASPARSTPASAPPL